ncbi:hypothetical protein [Pseudomonas sp. F01002]|uniref:hypothetical protein n=1 Tax=Pseudomonas sp. F01002 TaxID=2555724 RepID=UPI00106CF445|nr:hypothetical protein [Pseudomonas sp. F01002]TFB39014.1 hypothetical protein E3W21_17680 [Pseudomonas sp. F01002]
MSFWKVLGGAAVGIATVVALPVAGPIGAITLLGAGIAAGVGAAGGGVAAYFDDSEEQATAKAELKAKAEYAKKYENLEKAFADRVNTDARYFDLILAMGAVGLACAACDGQISTVERREIDEFIAGVASAALPERVKATLAEMAKNPPDIKTAYALAIKAAPDMMDAFDDIIEIVSNADGHIHQKEAEFKSAWAQLRAA